MVPIPLRDELPSRRFPAVTIGIIVANSLVWLYQLVYGVDLSILDFGAIPAWVLNAKDEGAIYIPHVGQAYLDQEIPFPLTVLTSMFMHGGWLHIIGNMWFLWIFGDNVEDAMGRVRFVVFYLLCGIAAALAQIFTTPASTVPMVGASGAIGGVMGAYALLYPRARVHSIWILIIFVTFVDVPAWLLLGIWLVAQFLIPGTGVAWMAHVGGFLAGMALVLLFARRERYRPLRQSVFARGPRPPGRGGTWPIGRD